MSYESSLITFFRDGDKLIFLGEEEEIAPDEVSVLINEFLSNLFKSGINLEVEYGLKEIQLDYLTALIDDALDKTKLSGMLVQNIQ